MAKQLKVLPIWGRGQIQSVKDRRMALLSK